MSRPSKNSGFWLAFLLTLTAEAGGHFVGTGGDYPDPSAGAAWFSAKRLHTYCIQVSSDFGYSKRELHVYIQDVFRHWAEYMRSKHVSLNSILPHMDWSEFPCETGNPDLKFYFGTKPADVLKVYPRYRRPVAIADRSNSFIWVEKPNEESFDGGKVDWTLPGRLFGILSHEVGHVLGCDHADGTILSPNIFRLLFVKPISREDETFYRNIDFENEVAECLDCSKEWSGRLGSPRATQEDEKELFEFLTGRPAQGSVSASLLRSDRFTYELNVRDAQGERSFPFRIAPGNSSLVESGWAAFRLHHKVGSSYHESALRVLSGWMNSKLEVGTKGTPYAVVLEKNLQAFSPQLYLIDTKGERRILFSHLPPVRIENLENLH